MGRTEAGSLLKGTLTGICRRNGWSYGVFWSFDQRNSMLLTLEDVCYEEQVGMVAAHLLQQVHMLGEGAVGMAAFTGNHRWIFSDGGWNSSMFLGSQQDDSEFQQQFSCGIKTVAVIPVHPHGVIQLGSTRKIFESLQFLVDTKKSLCQVINDGGHVPLKTTFMASNTDICDLDELFTPLVSSGYSDDWSLSAVHGDCRQDLVATSSASMDSYLFDFSTASCEPSVLLSDQLPTFEIRDQDARSPSYVDFGFDSCRSTSESGKRSSTIDNVQQSSLLPVTEGELMDSVTSLPNFYNECLSEDFTLDLPDISLEDDLFQWFDSSPELGTDGAATTLIDNLAQPIRVSMVPSNLIEVDTLVHNLNKNPVVSSQSAVTHVSNGLIDGLGSDFGCAPFGKSPEIIISEAQGSHPGGYECISAYTSKLVEGSSDHPRKRLFWELGIEELLDGLSNNSSVTNSGVENQSSASKRTKMESLLLHGNDVRSSGPCSSMVDKTDHFLGKKEVAPKPQVNSWIDDNYSTNVRSSRLEQSQKGEDPTKVNKKRAKPGESNRPRPKDRQQIQDRIKELRGIIPNGGKCSIDSLLDRTIKYMLFLHSVTKYSDKLKQSNKPKLIEQENDKASNDKFNTEMGGGGITWAFKVGATPRVCPVIVEDLSSAGQMLVEMLCEERGLFLEIADMIRSCGLTILKGVMEIKEDKIWAQFVVEVKLNTNQSITRINVFLTLMELLQQTEIELANQPGSGNINDGVVRPQRMDCIQNTISLPIQ